MSIGTTESPIPNPRKETSKKIQQLINNKLKHEANITEANQHHKPIK
jgi:hypothetical protein